jgi:hypothetical protein
MNGIFAAFNLVDAIAVIAFSLSLYLGCLAERQSRAFRRQRLARFAPGTARTAENYVSRVVG